MKTAVIGPGALGCLFAARLSARAACDIWLLDHDGKRAAGLRNAVVLVEEDHKAEVHSTADPVEVGPVDLVLLCIKSSAVKEALIGASSLFHPTTLLIAFQNGISHPEIIEQAELPGYSALGVTSEGATLLAPGRVSHRGEGQTSLGFMSETDQQGWSRLEEAGRILAAGGFVSEVVPDIRNHLWKKLLVNVGINGLTVIYDCANGELLSNSRARELMREAVREGVAVARGEGIDPGPNPVAYTEEVCRRTAANVSSMLQDVRRGVSTEIAAINGALIAKAKTFGIDIPVNRLIVDKVREIEKRHKDPGRTTNEQV